MKQNNSTTSVFLKGAFQILRTSRGRFFTALWAAVFLGTLSGCFDVAPAPSDKSGTGKGGQEEQEVVDPGVVVTFNITPADALSFVAVKLNSTAVTLTTTEGKSKFKAKRGDTVTFSIAPAAEPYLGVVKVDLRTVSTFPYTFEVWNASTVTLPFIMQKRTVTVNKADGGTVVAKPAIAYPLQTVTLSLTPTTTADDTMWFLSALTVNQANVPAPAASELAEGEDAPDEEADGEEAEDSGFVTVETVKTAPNTYTFVMPDFPVVVDYNFTRTISRDARLLSLKAVMGNVSQGLDANSELSTNEPFRPDTFAYTMTAGPEVENLTFSYKTGHADATTEITIEGSRTLLPLPAGVTTVNLVVIAQDGITKEKYTVVITKAPSAELSSITARGDDFSAYPYVFSSPSESSSMSIMLPYSSRGVYQPYKIKLQPKYPAPGVSFTYSGTGAFDSVTMAETVFSNTVSPGSGASPGKITVTATAGDMVDSKTYTLAVARRNVSNTRFTASSGGEVRVYFVPEEKKWYEAYLFTSGGSHTLTVPESADVDAEVFIAGGGGGGGGAAGSSTRGQGGGGGAVASALWRMSGSYTIAAGVGGIGGSASAGGNQNGGVGGASSIASNDHAEHTLTAAGGVGGESHYQDGWDGSAQSHGAGAGIFLYSGKEVKYGYNGSGIITPANTAPQANTGCGGSKRSDASTNGVAGAGGIVIVRVPVAP